MSITKALNASIVVAYALFIGFGSSDAQVPSVQQGGAAPGGASVAQFASQPANNVSAPAAGSPQVGPGQAGGSAPINKIISPPSTGFSAPAQNAGPAANSNLVDPVGNRRAKRQAGIPPVCCTKDPCDPCATTPCIACPLCG